MRPDVVGLGGFDSHAFPPRAAAPSRAGRGRRLALTVAAAVLAATPVMAQRPQPPQPQRVALKPPITPGHAFFASLAVPGLAQARLDRKSGLLFASFEALSLAMWVKSRHDLALAKAFAGDSTPLSYVTDASTGLPVRDPKSNALQVAEWSKPRYDAGRIHARSVHVEDWVAMLILNHLCAGIDGYVEAQLWDLPAQVEVRGYPGGARVGAQIRW